MNTTLSLPMRTRLVINGANRAPSAINPVVSASSFENQIKVSLPANSDVASAAGETPPDPGEHDTDIEIDDA